MSHAIDELDLIIIQQLQVDPRTSITELSKKIELSRPTTTLRLKRLLDEKLIVLKGGLNLQFGFKVVHVGLEVLTDKTRREVETYLRNARATPDITYETSITDHNELIEYILLLIREGKIPLEALNTSAPFSNPRARKSEY